jgi:methionyl-tRNA formyltransferase
MNKVNFAFFGSAYFSAIFLEAIIKDEELKKRLDLKFVVTQPDKPSGRKQVMTPTPVKQIAHKYNFPVYDYGLEMRKSKSGSSYGVLALDKVDQKTFTDLDIVLVYAYGAIISRKVLELPKFGFWNIHPSLLPLYRGTAPMATPLINGDKNTGISIIKMDNKMDHGPIIDQISYTIAKSDKRPYLETKLTNMGMQLFKSKIVEGIENIKPKEQDEKKATYTEKLKKDDGFIKFEELKRKIIESPEKLYNLYRGLYPWPGIWTMLPNGKRLKITAIEYENKLLEIRKVQLEGKNEVDFKTFNKAYGFF